MKDMHPTAFDEKDVYALMFVLERHGALHVKGRVDVSDILSVNFDEVDGTWMVCNLDGSEEWLGVDTDKSRAIIKYLAKRLGIKEE